VQFAIAIPTDADSWRLVRRAEELGFARAWFYDTQMLSADPFVAMAAAAIKTTKIRLGTGVCLSRRTGWRRSPPTPLPR
jgi:5,10-methylenetetrahydromethanopterin reductase